ncbi:MAG TPA: polymer-forming cytoskeletal protein [Pyrinomonadaceae bacterium]|nr:polymer-forming cytoskeletal protein [Pyrinomonadaceae bacterium]
MVNEAQLEREFGAGAMPVLLRALLASLALLLIFAAAHAEGTVVPQPLPDDRTPVVVDGVNEHDVYGFGQTIIVRGTVKHGAASFGGDVIVEGTVEGDVAAIGGSVIQREGSRIGGDVAVFGGTYHHGTSAPNRNPQSMTIVVAGLEQELRNMMRDPTTVLAPRLTPIYLGQRLLAVLFWFVMSLALTAVTPGSVSRAVARLHLSNVRVGLIGLLGAVVLSFGFFISLMALPTAVGALVGVMALLFLLLAYLFGRVAIQAATGRWLQKLLLAEGRRSESLALLLGTGFWVMVLSLPYVWPMAFCGLLVASLGLALTARYRMGWKRAEA